MTCVLSMTPLYTNACSVFSEDGNDLQNNNCDGYDFNWIHSQHTAPGLSDSQRRATPCRIEASTSSSISCRLEISNGHAAPVFKHDPLNVHIDVDKEPDIGVEDRVVHETKSAPTDGFEVVSNLVEMCNKTDAALDQHSTRSQGHKRKAEEALINETYIPSKRISPFLNTPKERKDERKKVLKISIKKLKQLDDPEIFLRRTVLVNNTMKRLQTEAREEKLRTRKNEMRKKKSFNGYGVLNNNCLSNSYLFDDPFLSGVHEKITDDMTDTLMHNVFHDKPADAASADNPNNISCQVSTNIESRVDSSQLSSLDISNDMSSGLDTSTSVPDNSRSVAVQPSMQGSGDISNHVALETPVADTMRDNPEMSDNRCDEVMGDNRCKNSSIIEISKYACHDKCEPMELGIRETASTPNIEIQSSEINRMNNEDTMLCSRLHLTNSMLVNSTDVQIQSTDTFQKHLHNEKDNSLKTSKSAITDLEHVSENTCGLELLDLDHKLDQKSLSHSFNTFLSDFDITHSIPIPLSYKES